MARGQAVTSGPLTWGDKFLGNLTNNYGCRQRLCRNFLGVFVGGVGSPWGLRWWPTFSGSAEGRFL